MLLELILYSGLAFRDVRERAAALTGKLPFWLLASAIVPYLLASTFTGTFAPHWFALLILIAAAVIWWFRLLPGHGVFDVLFLVLVAGVYLSGVFKQIYSPPVPQLRVEILGQLMLIRLSVTSVLLFRRMSGAGFGFIPTKREWWIGLKNYLYFMPIGVALMYGLDFARFEPADGWWWKAVGTFIGILWVVALSEELFFRGLLLQWTMKWFGKTAALIVTSLAFGAVHLPFREFPNWQFALMAAVAGWFYGRAFLQGNGIRAAMVSHALVVATWRTLFG